MGKSWGDGHRQESNRRCPWEARGPDACYPPTRECNTPECSMTSGFWRRGTPSSCGPSRNPMPTAYATYGSSSPRRPRLHRAGRGAGPLHARHMHAIWGQHPSPARDRGEMRIRPSGGAGIDESLCEQQDDTVPDWSGHRLRPRYPYDPDPSEAPQEASHNEGIVLPMCLPGHSGSMPSDLLWRGPPSQEKPCPSRQGPRWTGQSVIQRRNLFPHMSYWTGAVSTATSVAAGATRVASEGRVSSGVTAVPSAGTASATGAAPTTAPPVT